MSNCVFLSRRQHNIVPEADERRVREGRRGSMDSAARG
jgi:hypothetical protein